MSRSQKSEKRRRSVKGRFEESVKDAITARHAFGHTEKIRRRNRKTWVRLANKRRRALDGKEIAREN